MAEPWSHMIADLDDLLSRVSGSAYRGSQGAFETRAAQRTIQFDGFASKPKAQRPEPDQAKRLGSRPRNNREFSVSNPLQASHQKSDSQHSFVATV
jgi:hypothetical protein